jgi:outer membrane lipoprotein-sorting protein
MTLQFQKRTVAVTVVVLAVIAGLNGAIGVAGAQEAPEKKTDGFAISRANLAQSATFTVTQTIAPKGGNPLVRSYKVEIKGEKARLDYSDQMVGEVRYLANDKGVFLYIPVNKNAMKQSFKGGVDGALKLAFAQVRERMATAKKIGEEKVGGIPTTVYLDSKTGGKVYIGNKTGFRLPVKTILTNEGGVTSLEVKNIKLNVSLDDSRFALPAGTKIIESENGSPPGGIPVGR